MVVDRNDGSLDAAKRSFRQPKRLDVGITPIRTYPEIVDIHTPYDEFYARVDIAGIAKQKGLGYFALVHRYALRPIQPLEQYETEKRDRAKEMLSRFGREWLLENPIVVAAIIQERKAFLALVDGHHRTRYSMPLKRLPAIILTPDQIDDIIAEEHGKKGKPFVRDTLYAIISGTTNFLYSATDPTNIRMLRKERQPFLLPSNDSAANLPTIPDINTFADLTQSPDLTSLSDPANRQDFLTAA